MAIPPVLHPAIPASAHLIPGIKQWAATFIADLSRVSFKSLQAAPWDTIKVNEHTRLEETMVHADLGGAMARPGIRRQIHCIQLSAYRPACPS